MIFSRPYSPRLCYSVASVCRRRRLSSSSSSSVTLCIVAKRCVLEQKLQLTAYNFYRMSEIDWYQNEWPWPLFKGRIKVMSTIASYSLLTVSETVRDRQRLRSKVTPIGNGIWGIKWSRNGRRHVTPTQIRLKPSILKTAGNRESVRDISPDSLASCISY